MTQLSLNATATGQAPQAWWNLPYDRAMGDSPSARKFQMYMKDWYPVRRSKTLIQWIQGLMIPMMPVTSSTESSASLKTSKTFTENCLREDSARVSGKTCHNSTGHFNTLQTSAGRDAAWKWNDAEENLTGYLTKLQWEYHQALARFHNSINVECTRDGHNNDYVYKQIHRYIEYLVVSDLLPDSAIIGRLNVANFTRTALAVEYVYLSDNKYQIMYALQKRYKLEYPEEVFKCLEQASILATYDGLVACPSEVASLFISFVGNLPTKSMQSTLLRSSSNLNSTRERFSQKTTK